MIRDHDYLETNDAWFFCVVGDVHPPDGFFAYLKYMPGDGPWRRKEQSFARSISNYSMSELQDSIQLLKRLKPDFVRLDPYIGAEMSMVPAGQISRHYSCREAVERIQVKEKRDELEELALTFVEELEEQSGVSRGAMGFTGSLLLGIHHERSDIDLIIYGRREFWRVLKALEELGYTGMKGDEKALRKLLARYPIGRAEAEKLLERIRHKGRYRGVVFSVHGVRKPEELEERYGDKVYRRVGLMRALLEVENSEDSGFNPAIYRVAGWAEDMEGRRREVRQLMCYDLTYLALFRPGDRLEAYGKLELVRDKRKEEEFHSLLIGSVEAAGREYVKLL